MSLFEDANLITTANGLKTEKLFSLKPFDGSGDFTWLRNTSATRVNQNNTIESVTVNVPRLDYLNSQCPCILVEPQRTNLILSSDDFGNSSWMNLMSSTVIPDSEISPSGLQDADKIVSDALFAQSPSLIVGQTYTLSIYAKSESSLQEVFMLSNNFETAAPTSISPNGYTRALLIFTATVPDGLVGFFCGLGVYVWGAQLELGSNVTSYIPTTSSAVTRNADIGTINTTGLGLNQITETFQVGAPNVITTIPTTYQLPNNRIKTIIGI